MKHLWVPAALAAACVYASPGHAQTIDKPSLSLDGARKVIAAVKQDAVRRGAPGAAIAVVDDGGNLLALERLDGTFAAGANISIGKARTATLFRRPTRVFEELINKGRTSMTALTDFTPLQGGVPILQNGRIIGAVGVSGAASAQQDDELAIAGAAIFDATTPSPVGTAGTSDVSHLNSGFVASAFDKGAPLIETPAFKVHASRRVAPGQAEIHELDTDIVYVLEGSATLVTGGRATDAKATAPDEIRGASIDGGVSRPLVKGDVVIIPNGVPHWFKEVKGPFLYYVVKVTQPRRQS